MVSVISCVVVSPLVFYIEAALLTVQLSFPQKHQFAWSAVFLFSNMHLERLEVGNRTFQLGNPHLRVVWSAAYASSFSVRAFYSSPIQQSSTLLGIQSLTQRHDDSTVPLHLLT